MRAPLTRRAPRASRFGAQGNNSSSTHRGTLSYGFDFLMGVEFSAALPSPGPVRFVLHEPSAAELARSVANGAPPAGGAPPSTRPHSTPRWRSLATAAKPGDGGAAAPPAPIGIAAKRGNGRWVVLMFDCGGAQTCAVAPELAKQV